MPSQGLEQLVERAAMDDGYAARLLTDPEGVIAEYNLTEEERRTLRSRDPEQLRSIGLDPRPPGEPPRFHQKGGAR